MNSLTKKKDTFRDLIEHVIWHELKRIVSNVDVQVSLKINFFFLQHTEAIVLLNLTQESAWEKVRLWNLIQEKDKRDRQKTWNSRNTECLKQKFSLFRTSNQVTVKKRSFHLQYSLWSDDQLLYFYWKENIIMNLKMLKWRMKALVLIYYTYDT